MSLAFTSTMLFDVSWSHDARGASVNWHRVLEDALVVTVSKSHVGGSD